MADFIITSLQSWDIEIGSTIKNTASEIAKKHRVLYVNPPMDIATRLRVAAGRASISYRPSTAGSHPKQIGSIAANQ